MVHRHYQIAAGAPREPVNLRNKLAREEDSHGVAAKSDDELWLEQPYLLVKPWAAGCHFLGQRVAVAGRPAFDDIGNKDLWPREADGAEKVVEQLAGSPHEGPALSILMEARTLANEHDLGALVALSGHNLCSLFAEAAGNAFPGSLGEFPEI